MKLKRFIEKELADSVTALKARLRLRKQEIRSFKSLKQNTLIFSVSIKSFWEDQGGKSIVYRNQTGISLEEAIIKAIAKFKRVNHRVVGFGCSCEDTYIQNFCGISVILPHGTQIVLPGKFWLGTAEKAIMVRKEDES